MLHWAVCDLLGRTVAEVGNANGGSQAVVPLNGRRTGSLILSFDDPAAAEAAPLLRTVKCWLDSDLILFGPMLKPGFDMQQRVVTIPIVDPSFRLERSFVNNRSDVNFNTGVNVLTSWVAEDQAQIVRALVDHARVSAAEAALGVPDIGIVQGNLQSGGVLRDWPVTTGDQIWQRMLDVTAADDGIELDLRPLDRTDGIMVALDTHYPTMGRDLSDAVVFEIGLGLDNATQLVWTPSGDEIRNRSTVQGTYTDGDPPNLYQSNQPDSQLLYGIYQAYAGRSDIQETTILEALAKADCAGHAFPPDEFTITPALDDGTGRYRDTGTGQIRRVGGRYGQPPRVAPSGDCWIGDIIGVRAFDRPAVELETEGRVTQATFTGDEDGAVVTEVTCTPATISVQVT